MRTEGCGLLMCVFPLVSSCTGPGEIGSAQDPLPTVVGIVLQAHDISGKVLSIGHRSHLSGPCTFVFECDCCEDKVAFGPDGTLHWLSRCVGDESCQSGIWTLRGDTLRTSLGGACTFRMYNWDHDMATTLPEFILKDTVVAPSTLDLVAGTCGEGFKFTVDTTEEVGLVSKTTFADFMDQLDSSLRTAKRN